VFDVLIHSLYCFLSRECNIFIERFSVSHFHEWQNVLFTFYRVMNTRFYSNSFVTKFPIVFHPFVWRRHKEIHVYIVENIGYPIRHSKLEQNVGYEVALNEKCVHTYIRTYVHTYIHNTYVRTYIHTLLYKCGIRISKGKDYPILCHRRHRRGTSV